MTTIKNIKKKEEIPTIDMIEKTNIYLKNEREKDKLRIKELKKQVLLQLINIYIILLGLFVLILDLY